MPSDWESAQFSDLAERMVRRVNPEDFGDRPYIGLEHIGEGSLGLLGLGDSRKIVSTSQVARKGEIVFGKLRPYFRKVVRAPREVIVTGEAWVIAAKPGVDLGFLFYAVANPAFVDRLSMASTGTRMPRAVWDVAESAVLPVPPPGEQRRVAAVLEALDDKIELNRKMNQTLEEMAQAIFKSWFIDFDGHDPADLVDSELGPIPPGWAVRSIYDLCGVIYGAPFKSKFFNDEGVGRPLIRNRDLKTQDPGKFTTEAHPKETLVQPGDILASMDAEFRPYTWTGPDSLLNQRVCAFRAKEHVPPAVLFRLLQRPLAYWERAKVGTTVIHLAKKDIDTIRLSIPSPETLAQIGTVLTPLLERTVQAALESRTLANLRDTLLPKLLSGKIRVPEAEKQVEAAL
jgi:type I restriction enzyme S subunit